MSLHTASPEDQATLVAHQQALLTAVPLFLGHLPHKAAIAAFLDNFVFTGLIALVQVAVLVFAGNGDPSGAVQLLQLAETALLLDDAAFFGIRM